MLVLVTGKADFKFWVGIAGFAGEEATIELQVAGLRIWISFDIGSTDRGVDIIGNGCWD